MTVISLSRVLSLVKIVVPPGIVRISFLSGEVTMTVSFTNPEDVISVMIVCPSTVICNADGGALGTCIGVVGSGVGVGFGSGSGTGSGVGVGVGSGVGVGVGVGVGSGVGVGVGVG